MKNLCSLDEFSGGYKNEGKDKPVMIVTVDGSSKQMKLLTAPLTTSWHMIFMLCLELLMHLVLVHLTELIEAWLS